MRIFKITLAIILLLIALFCFALYGAGNHGQFMFRPHMLQDWLIWGTCLVSFVLGVLILYKELKSSG